MQISSLPVWENLHTGQAGSDRLGIRADFGLAHRVMGAATYGVLKPAGITDLVYSQNETGFALKGIGELPT